MLQRIHKDDFASLRKKTEKISQRDFEIFAYIYDTIQTNGDSDTNTQDTNTDKKERNTDTEETNTDIEETNTDIEETNADTEEINIYTEGRDTDTMIFLEVLLLALDEMDPYLNHYLKVFDEIEQISIKKTNTIQITIYHASSYKGRQKLNIDFLEIHNDICTLTHKYPFMTVYTVLKQS